MPLVEMGFQLNTFWCLTSPLLSAKAKNIICDTIQVPTVILVPYWAFYVSSLRSYWRTKSYVVINFGIYIVRDEFCRKIFLHSLKVTPFHCLLRPKTQKSNEKNAFWIFLKSGPKFSNFGLKSPIFGRFSKFFFQPHLLTETHIWS